LYNFNFLLINIEQLLNTGYVFNAYSMISKLSDVFDYQTTNKMFFPINNNIGIYAPKLPPQQPYAIDVQTIRTRKWKKDINNLFHWWEDDEDNEIDLYNTIYLNNKFDNIMKCPVSSRVSYIRCKNIERTTEFVNNMLQLNDLKLHYINPGRIVHPYIPILSIRSNCLGVPDQDQFSLLINSIGDNYNNIDNSIIKNGSPKVIINLKPIIKNNALITQDELDNLFRIYNSDKKEFKNEIYQLMCSKLTSVSYLSSEKEMKNKDSSLIDNSFMNTQQYNTSYSSNSSNNISSNNNNNNNYIRKMRPLYQ